VNAENEGIVESFLKENKGQFSLVSAKSIWEKILTNVDWPCTQSDFLKLSPAVHNMEGFFVAVFERN
jgi:16S rRNA C967 or C1407 C5-methylase (RsmB/RsmF family)